MTKLTIALALVLSAPMFASSALAKGATTQNHHCVKNGTAMPDETHKQCTKEGGKWEKDAAAPKTAAEGDKKAEPAVAKKDAELAADKRVETKAEPPAAKKAEPPAAK
jgi:hypothetical protein